MPMSAKRVEKKYGHRWRWVTSGIFRPHWRSTSGKDVIIFPPLFKNDSWSVGLRHEEGSDGYHLVLPKTTYGEKKAFTFAERLRTGEEKPPS